MPRTRARDPRPYQIAVLATLLGYAVLHLGLPIPPSDAALVLGTALATQLAWTRLLRLPRFDPRSPLISGLSLCLLLRSNEPLLLIVAALLTISSKFLFRIGDKHLFNPTNFGLVAMMLVSDRVWVAPGQWGSAAYLVVLIAGLGGLVVNRAERSDVTWAFLVAYAGIVFGRAAWLGDPWPVPLHHLQNGALLIFAFLMISDPKTTPDSRAGRILFAVLVAAGAGFVHFGLFRPYGFLWALAGAAFTVPLIDRLLPGRRYRWGGSTPEPQFPQGETHDRSTLAPSAASVRALTLPLPRTAR